MTRHSLSDTLEFALTHPDGLLLGGIVVLILFLLAYLKGRVDRQ